MQNEVARVRLKEIELSPGESPDRGLLAKGRTEGGAALKRRERYRTEEAEGDANTLLVSGSESVAGSTVDMRDRLVDDFVDGVTRRTVSTRRSSRA